jgi:hypothetical protein
LRELSAAHVEALLEARRKAGLSPGGR